MNIEQIVSQLNFFMAKDDLEKALEFINHPAVKTKLDRAAVALIVAKIYHRIGRTRVAQLELEPFVGTSSDHAFWWGKLAFDGGDIASALDAWEPFWKHFDRSHHLPQYLQALLVSDLPQEVLLERQTYWGHQLLRNAPVKSGRYMLKWDGQRPLNVAYFAASWDGITIRRIFTNHLPYHDRKRLRVFGYSSVPVPLDLIPCFDVTRVVPHSIDSLIEIANLDQIDVFLETTGISPGSKFDAMAVRVAPIQYSHLNHFGTTGIPNVDFILADRITPNEHQQAYFSDRISRMSGCFLSYTYPAELKYQLIPPSTHLPSITFGCFSSQHKIGLHFLRACSAIVNASPRHRLLFRNHYLNDETNRLWFISRLQSVGIPTNRVELLNGCSHEQLMQSYDTVDIALDTFPYNGGNSVCEPLWQGVPIVSLCGEKFVESYAASILIHSGVSELIAYSEEEYIDLALHLANNREKLIEYRSTLRQTISNAGFNCGRSFASRLEDRLLSDAESVLSLHVG